MISGNSGGHSTESIGFRLNKRDLAQLRELAALRRESLNTLVSQILDRYLKLWIYDHSYGFFPVSEDVLRISLSKLKDREIEEMARGQASRVHREIIKYIFGDFTKESVISYLEIFGQRFETHKHFVKGSMHTITVYHGVSLPFSKLYYHILKEILALSGIRVFHSRSDITEAGFSIVFGSET